MTREQLAHEAGVSVSTVQKIEVGPVVEPGYFTVLALASCVDLDLSSLTRNVDEVGPPLSAAPSERPEAAATQIPPIRAD